jgi:hypothetical protein
MIFAGGSNPTLFATSYIEVMTSISKSKTSISGMIFGGGSNPTLFDQAFSSMSGTILKPQNSYTYIEVINLDIDHDIEYNEFIYIHRHPPISGVFSWADGIPYIRCYVQHKIQVTPEFNFKLKLICVHIDLSLCMNLHVLSSCSDPLSLSLAKTVCASQ